MKELGGLKVGNLFHLKARARQASLSKQRGFAALAARRSLQGGFACHGCGLARLPGKNLPSFRVRLLYYRVDSIQVISALASSQGTSIGSFGAQIGCIPTETAKSSSVCTPRPYFFD